MDYEIFLSAIQGKSSELEGLSTAINSTVDNLLSDLSTINGTEIASIYGKIEEPSERLKNGYGNCSTWLSQYISELDSLESSLAGFSVAGVDTPSEFTGEFTDMFGKLVMPTLKTGGDKNANLSSGKLGESFSEKGQKITDSAYNVPSPGLGLCAMWVSQVYANAGYPYPGGDACDMYNNWCTSDDRSKLEPGMIVAVSTHTHTPNGQIYGHVAIYMGNGMVRDNVGHIRDISLDEWLNYYGTTVTPKWGWIPT